MISRLSGHPTLRKPEDDFQHKKNSNPRYNKYTDPDHEEDIKDLHDPYGTPGIHNKKREGGKVYSRDVSADALSRAGQ